MRRKKLTELYRISEGPFDDINKSLSGARSVADPRSKDARGLNRAYDNERPRHGFYTPDTAKAQSDIDQSKSVFDEALGGETPVSLTAEEINWIVSMAQRSQGSAWAYGSQKAPDGLADKLNKAEQSTGSSSMSMTRTTKQGF